jgi:hypothetical protein
MSYFNILILILLFIIIYVVVINNYKNKELFINNTLLDNINNSKPSSMPFFHKKQIIVPIEKQQTNINSIEAIQNKIGLNKMLIEYPKFYPIGTNFDLQFYNYNNLISGSSISIINEILESVRYKINKNNKLINYNPSLKQSIFYNITENNVINYAKEYVNIMNSISNRKNSFTFIKVIPVSKEQIENQIRLNFQIQIIYNYAKSKTNLYEIRPDNFPLMINVILLFEKMYQNEDQFFKNNKKTEIINIYLDTFALIGITNDGYLPGNYTKSKYMNK